MVALADRREQVSVSRGGRRGRRPRCTDAAADLSTRYPIYGRTTGVGANRTTPVRPPTTELRDAPASQPRGRRRATPSTTERSARCSRCGSCSCVCPALDSTPRSCPASSDAQRDALPELLPLRVHRDGRPRAARGTALTLIGERPATKPLTPMEPWGADSALPFMSSSALTVGRGCLAWTNFRDSNGHRA